MFYTAVNTYINSIAGSMVDNVISVSVYKL